MNTKTYGPTEPIERSWVSYGAIAFPGALLALEGPAGIPRIDVRRALPCPPQALGVVAFENGVWVFHPSGPAADDIAEDADRLVAVVVEKYSKGLRP